ncbi:hypothetical protein [Providencia phage Kokobel2]|nr:hypothetical protein [Providencia phage Kokobel2]
MWDKLKGPLWAAGARYDRVESPATAPSFPDVVYTWNGHHGFIEMKTCAKGPKLDLSHFTSGQRNWLRERCTGKNVFLLVYVKADNPSDDSWHACRGALAWGLSDRPSMDELEGYSTNVFRGDCMADVSLFTKWLKGWL